MVAAIGDLEVLESLYDEVLVPLEVVREIAAGGIDGLAVRELEQARGLTKRAKPVEIGTLLANSLDLGEAAVIQLALDEQIPTVAIDEAVGRRVAKLCGLQLTGSVGILLKARAQGFDFSMRTALERMRARGIWLSQGLVDSALKLAEE